MEKYIKLVHKNKINKRQIDPLIYSQSVIRMTIRRDAMIIIRGQLNKLVTF